MPRRRFIRQRGLCLGSLFIGSLPALCSALWSIASTVVLGASVLLMQVAAAQFVGKLLGDKAQRDFIVGVLPGKPRG